MSSSVTEPKAPGPSRLLKNVRCKARRREARRRTPSYAAQADRPSNAADGVFQEPARLLIQGIGNPSRGDDALGPTVISELGEGDFTSEWQYQLQVEHAEQWSHFDVVILIDAHANLHESFEWKELKPSDMELSISSHQLAPETVLAMNHAYFQNHPRVFLLALRSQSFDLGAPLTPVAQEALKAGLAFLLSVPGPWMMDPGGRSTDAG